MGWGDAKFGVALKSGILTLPRRVALAVVALGEGESPADAVLLTVRVTGHSIITAFYFGTQPSGWFGWVCGTLQHRLLLQAN